MNRLSRGKSAALFALALVVSMGSAHADPALIFSSTTGHNVGNGPFSIGWTFDLISPVAVTALGWFDDGGDGLEESHMIGIWGPAPDRALLHSVLIPSGTSAPLEGQFRSVAIPTLNLPVGKGYTIGGQTAAGITERVVGGTDPFSTVAQSLDWRITYRAPVVTVGDASFTRPYFPLGNQGLYGASFSVIFEPPPTPTPNPTAVPPPLSVSVSSTTLKAGDKFTLAIALNNSITQPFDFYFVMTAPRGVFTIFLDGRIAQGIKALFKNVPGIAAPVGVTVWNDITVPPVPTGTYTFYVVAVQAGKIPPVSSLDQLSSSTEFVVMFDKKAIIVQ